jgi:predicted ArsR family transcriptional regulator
MRPPGQCRQALLAVIGAGVTGTFDALARHAQVPERKAQQTLWDLRREGLVVAQRCAAACDIAPQRQRAIYTPSTANDSQFNSLNFARQVWR